MIPRRLPALAALLVALFIPAPIRSQSLAVRSPDGRTTLVLALSNTRLTWAVTRDGAPVVMPSRFGFAFRGAPPFETGLRLADSARASVDAMFSLPLGEVARVRDRHNELRVRVAETAAPHRELWVVARAFDDGIGFRYEFPDQPNLKDFEIMDELTEFSMAEDMKAWWIPADIATPDRQEMLWSSGPISKLDLVQTPLTLVGTGGLHAVIHEANLVDYAGMALQGRSESRTLRTSLARWKDGSAVKGRTPFVTPWRTLQLAERPEDLAPSVLGLKLNPPSRIADTRWIRPMKYNGIWWGMHVNTMTWSSGPLHGATTANARRYIDFAAANGLGGTLVEGWNLGWDKNWMLHGDEFSFTRAYPDYDLPGVAAYARQKGVSLIVHNETGTFVENYERQLDSAFALYQRLGVTAIKTGYVGDTVNPGGHAHQGQYMVRHHRRVIEAAASRGIGVVMHEPIKDTGERRTWPNMLSREGARGQEYNAWGGEGGNPPEHETILFFTRLLSGPVDFTPGIFNLLISRSGTNVPRAPTEARPRTTLAKQLALYVVLYSPVQMAADLIENYEGQPGFQFIRDVAVDWDTTRVLHGRIGDDVVVARKTKGRDEWFVGAITDEEARTIEVALDFLPKGRAYVAEVYADGTGANWRDNPLALAISRQPVNAATRLRIAMAAGGGQAIRIRPAR
ncbi:MAG: alpha-glucosidase [Gemmatimonas sp.]|nr:alpha-glucosidase [Gemmatimonas sp.]